MSGLLSMRRAAPPRHSLRALQPRRQRFIGLRRVAELAKSAGLVLVAVVILFSAVFLLLAATNWAAERDTGSASSSGF